ncbi:MAG: dihydropteroate synthase [Bacteroidales bacterium]|nr:dihydropteroate synthase [Bacteroidales bacterium]MCM1148042.1 dihydropteroate synthase [Bacteroidales bacterium]MCM1206859.1 dihydropteroate synthase [Bacillota bacterium]MCM1511000.1 dihydropteroate synthase [Clostridium sp.]
MEYKLTIRGQQHVISRPEVMGILNCTPDSFYSGSRKQTEKEIASRADEIVSQGAAMIDIGGMSTRPGGTDVTEEEEMRRLRFALSIVRREQPDAIVSVDTFRPDVAKMAVEEFGADIINDVGEAEEFLQADLGWMRGIPYVLMSVQPTLEKTLDVFRKKTAAMQEKGIGDIILDPGYGFGKDIADNYRILSGQEKILEFGKPVLVGVSRKRMIWQLLGTSPREALNGTSVVNTLAVERGAAILRVHDVREAVECIRICREMTGRKPYGGTACPLP